MSEIKKVLRDATVEADMNVTTYPAWSRKETDAEYRERHAKELERACKDFHDHCRDHRSLDHIRLSVVRVYDFLCPDCGDNYDTEREAKACLSAHEREDSALLERGSEG